jgi:hypothetical protein
MNVSLEVRDELIILHKVARNCLFKTCWENEYLQLHINFSKNVQTLPKSHMHIFNVSITKCAKFEECQPKDVRGLLNYTKQVPFMKTSAWHTPFISQIHFVQPVAKLCGDYVPKNIEELLVKAGCSSS